MSGGRREGLTKKESVETASSTLGEGIDDSSHGGTPEEIRLGIIPVGDEEIGGSAENNAEVGIGVEEPLVGKSRVGDAGLARAIAGLEVLGARFEGENLDSKGKPEESRPEASLARGGGTRHGYHG